MTTPPSRRVREGPRALTFYAYEDGIGGAEALAGVAVLLAADGHRVLVVEGDPAAPAVRRLEVAPRRPGLADLVASRRVGRELDWRACIDEVRLVPGAPPVRVLHPGPRDELTAIDWDAMFEGHDFGNHLEALRREWLREFDFVLVDSQPGLGEIAGICTINLPDALVAVLTAEPRSLSRVVDVVRRARAARSSLPFARAHLAAIPVLARHESRPEHQRDHRRRAEAAEALGDLCEDFVPRDVSPLEALDVLRVPSVPRWEFHDRPAPRSHTVRDISRTRFAYGALARLLGSGLRWDADAIDRREAALIDAVIEVLSHRLPGFDGDVGRRGRARIAGYLEDVLASSEPVVPPSAEVLVSTVAGRVGTLGAETPGVVAVCAALAFVLGDPPCSRAAVRELPALVGDVLSRPSGRELIGALAGRR